MQKLMRDTPLSLRLTALYVAILITVLGILGGVIYVQVENFLLNDVRDRNLTGARNAINRATPFRRGTGFPGLPGVGTLPTYGATPVSGGGPGLGRRLRWVRRTGYCRGHHNPDGGRAAPRSDRDRDVRRR